MLNSCSAVEVDSLLRPAIVFIALMADATFSFILLLWHNFKMVLPVVLKCTIGCWATLSFVNSCSIGGRWQSGWRCCHRLLLLQSLAPLVQFRPEIMHREDNT